MAEKRVCSLCGEPLEERPLIHDVAKCENTELLKGRKKIKVLQQSLSNWKDAWYHCNEIIGRLHWFHPAIDNDAERAYHQGMRATFTKGKES